jgi:hypothetical protein
MPYYLQNEQQKQGFNASTAAEEALLLQILGEVVAANVARNLH